MFYSPKLSLSDILGKEYTASVAGALDALGVMPEKDAQAIAEEKVDFYPEALQKKNEELLDADIEALIAERQAARKEKNFARADEIRDELLARGIILKDTREGVQWKRA